MTILPRVHGGDTLTFEKPSETPPDATNPVVVSANFVLEVSHAHSGHGKCITSYIQSVDDLVQINEDGVAAAARYVRALSFISGLATLSVPKDWGSLGQGWLYTADLAHPPPASVPT